MSCENATTAPLLNITVPNCDPNEKLWWVFILSSIITLFGGLFLVCMGRLIATINKRVNRNRSLSRTKKANEKRAVGIKSGQKQDDIGCVTAAKDWAGELISGQTNSGRILVSNASHPTYSNVIHISVRTSSGKVLNTGIDRVVSGVPSSTCSFCNLNLCLNLLRNVFFIS